MKDDPPDGEADSDGGEHGQDYARPNDGASSHTDRSGVVIGHGGTLPVSRNFAKCPRLTRGQNEIEGLAPAKALGFKSPLRHVQLPADLLAVMRSA